MTANPFTSRMSMAQAGAVGALTGAVGVAKMAKEAKEAYDIIAEFMGPTAKSHKSGSLGEQHRIRKTLQKAFKAPKGAKVTSSKKNIAVKHKTMAPKTKGNSKSSKTTKKAKVGKVKKIENQVQKISKSLKSDQAYHTWHHLHSDTVTCTQGQVAHSSQSGINTSVLESAMANLRYYNPSTPGTLTTANASTGTYSRQIHFTKVFNKITARNNFQTPCKVTLYSVVPKNDTSIDPVTFFTDGVTDQVISGASTSPALHLTDIHLFNDNYKIIKSIAKNLVAGQEVSLSYSTDEFDYDPANVDTHGLYYQKKYRAQTFIVRLQGGIGHDPVNTTTETGFVKCGVDLMMHRKLQMSYDAGVNLDDIYVLDDTADVSATGLIGSYSVPDNITYSDT